MQGWHKKLPLLIIALLFFVGPSHATSLKSLLEEQLDPKLQYSTLETRHFRIHYSGDLKDAAESVARRVESIHDKVTQAIGISLDEKTEIVLVHKSDEPAIYTSVFPHRQIFLDAALPAYELGMNDYGDWHDWAITHEFTHIIHLEERGPAYHFLSNLFGSWLRPNQLQPPWVKEGLAVYYETQLTGHGRGHSNTYQMMMRMAYYDGILTDTKFAAPDTISNFDNKDWPWTLRPYLFGYYLIHTLQQKQKGPLGKFIEATGSSLPTRVGPGVRELGFESFQDLWNTMLKTVGAAAEKEIRELSKQPLTKLEYLTDTGYYHFNPELSPDGKRLLVTYDRPAENNEIQQFDLDGDNWVGPRALIGRSTGYQTSFSKSGRFVAFDQSAKSLRYYTISDIHLYDLKTDSIVSVSPYFGARDPTVHPDGKHLAFITNQQGKNVLVETDTSWRNEKNILGDVGFRRLTGPRYSPDGSAIVLSAHNDETGGEDLWLVQDGQAFVLLSDGHQNLFPRWSGDGAKIFYSSDRTGVANIYCIDLKGQKIWQMSHVLGGLFSPVIDPNNKWVYVSSYHGKGYDLARFPYDPTKWKKIGSLPELKLLPGPRAPASEPSPTESTPYTATRYLLPQYMRPSLLFRPGTVQIGGEIGAADPLYWHLYNLDIRYDTQTGMPVGKLFYYYGANSTALDLNIVRDVVPLSGFGIQQRSIAGDASANIPLGTDENNIHLRPGVFAMQIDSFGTATFMGPQLGFRYDTEFKQLGQSFPQIGSYLDINLREMYGHEVSGATAFTYSLRHNQELFYHHILHASIEGGWILTGKTPDTYFTAGGLMNFPYSLGSGYTLYGYDINAFVGSHIMIGDLWYTMPLIDIQRGPGEFPFQFGRLSLGLRGQIASVSDLGQRGEPWSAGIELIQDMLAVHIWDISARLGVYQGAPEFGGSTQFYFSLRSDE